MELGILGGLALIGNAINKNNNNENESQNIKEHHIDLTYHNSKNEVFNNNYK